MISRMATTNANVAYVTPSFRVGDPDVGSAPPAELLLYENGVLLGPADTNHDEIHSRSWPYSYWAKSQQVLGFSASDISDPRTNGRIYRITPFMRR